MGWKYDSASRKGLKGQREGGREGTGEAGGCLPTGSSPAPAPRLSSTQTSQRSWSVQFIQPGPVRVNLMAEGTVPSWPALRGPKSRGSQGHHREELAYICLCEEAPVASLGTHGAGGLAPTHPPAHRPQQAPSLSPGSLPALAPSKAMTQSQWCSRTWARVRDSASRGSEQAASSPTSMPPGHWGEPLPRGQRKQVSSSPTAGKDTAGTDQAPHLRPTLQAAHSQPRHLLGAPRGKETPRKCQPAPSDTCMRG